MFTNCTFENNRASVGGGAVTLIAFQTFDNVFDRCLFRDNTAVSSGGGVRVGPSGALFTNATFTGNRFVGVCVFVCVGCVCVLVRGLPRWSGLQGLVGMTQGSNWHDYAI